MLNAEVLLFLATGLACALLTAVLCKIAPALGLIDRPDNHRKLHARPIPLVGGLAVFAAMTVVLAPLAFIASPLRDVLWEGPSTLFSLPLAAAVIVAVGVADDRGNLRGRAKLLGQLLATAVLIAGGFVVHSVTMLQWEVELGLLAVPFTVFWLLGAINAINLLDGIDGLATTVGLILTSAIAVMAWRGGHGQVELVSIALSGCLLGFLVFNFPPARAFLGDTGSMLIGLVVGTLAIQASLKGPGTVLLAAPMAIWTIPVFDCSMALLRRKLTRRSIYSVDRGHLHHRLLARLGTSRRVLACVAAACTVVAGAALISVFWNSDAVALITSLAVVAVFVATGLFGRAEVFLLARRLGGFGRSAVQTAVRQQASATDFAFRLQGGRAWQTLWESLTEAAEKYSLQRIHLDVNFAAEHESYNAVWANGAPPDPERSWRVEVPLVHVGGPVGRLTIDGLSNGRSPYEDIEPLLELLEDVEARVTELVLQGVLPPGNGKAGWAQRAAESSSDLTRSRPR